MPRAAAPVNKVNTTSKEVSHMPKSNQTILLADEDDAARAFLATNLTADGYLVTAAEDRSKAIALLSVD